MPVAFPSIRVDASNDTHHLWCNNGTWWLHYTVHFDHRVRRIRKSLRTRSRAAAILRRDAHLAHVAAHGELVPDRRPARPLGTADRGGGATPTSRVRLTGTPCPVDPGFDAGRTAPAPVACHLPRL